MRGFGATVDLSNGETLFYRARDTGDVPVVLLHGNMSSSVHWDVVFERMDDRFTLYAPDIRGYGRSSYEEPIESIADLSADVGYFADELGLGTFHLWGWSSGAAVAMQHAIDDDRVDRLVLMGPPSPAGHPVYARADGATESNGGGEGDESTDGLTTRESLSAQHSPLMPAREAILSNDAESMREIWSKIVFVNGDPSPERFDAYVEETLRQRNLLDVAYALVHFDASPPADETEAAGDTVASVDAPTLVLQGEDDNVITAEMAREVAEAFPNGRSETLSDCAHAPTIDAPDRMLAVVESFLADGAEPD